jgi:hypothetical protein
MITSDEPLPLETGDRKWKVVAGDEADAVRVVDASPGLLYLQPTAAPSIVIGMDL